MPRSKPPRHKKRPNPRWAGVNALARKTGMSAHEVRRSIAKLRALGLIAGAPPPDGVAELGVDTRNVVGDVQVNGLGEPVALEVPDDVARKILTATPARDDE